ncbi:MAG: NUDIX domain-containing protein [Chitinophagaceae bacterium]|nr:NUDIX domain-containing protein [Chitinophagaceae bacterium]
MSAFTIRVYGILKDEQNNVIVSDEKIRGSLFTKFPGGGLEFGEGTRDCLVREFKEEMNLSVQVNEHIYTTDYFQRSAFNPSHQIVSIYYSVIALEPILIPFEKKPFEFNQTELALYEQTQQTETFRRIAWDLFSPNDLSLPIDKIVAQLLKEKS